jgi:hypothetical protein
LFWNYFYTTADAESGTKCAIGAWRVINLLSNACFFMVLTYRVIGK